MVRNGAVTRNSKRSLSSTSRPQPEPKPDDLTRQFGKECCPECQRPFDTADSRPVQESCRHVKCRKCLISYQNGCAQCNNEQERPKKTPRLTPKIIESSQQLTVTPVSAKTYGKSSSNNKRPRFEPFTEPALPTAFDATQRRSVLLQNRLAEDQHSIETPSSSKTFTGRIESRSASRSSKSNRNESSELFTKTSSPNSQVPSTVSTNHGRFIVEPIPPSPKVLKGRKKSAPPPIENKTFRLPPKLNNPTPSLTTTPVFTKTYGKSPSNIKRPRFEPLTEPIPQSTFASSESRSNLLQNRLAKEQHPAEIPSTSTGRIEGQPATRSCKLNRNESSESSTKTSASNSQTQITKSVNHGSSPIEPVPTPPPKVAKKKKKRAPVIILDHITIVSGTDTGSTMYQCDVCLKKFKTKAHIKYHEFCQNGEKPFKCEQCGQGFIAKSHYEYHLRTHTGERPYVCPQCGKGFNQRGKVTRHLRSHTGEKPFVCQQCGRGFANAQAMRSHYLIHTGERPFACEFCNKRFTGMTNLKKHVITHTGERPFMCVHCGKSFGLKWTLDLHLRTHSSERPYACEQCSRAFSNSKDLRRHLVIHSGERPFKCWICGTAFRRKDNLDRHIKNTHNQPKEVAKQLANEAAAEYLASTKNAAKAPLVTPLIPSIYPANYVRATVTEVTGGSETQPRPKPTLRPKDTAVRKGNNKKVKKITNRSVIITAEVSPTPSPSVSQPVENQEGDTYILPNDQLDIPVGSLITENGLTEPKMEVPETTVQCVEINGFTELRTVPFSEYHSLEAIKLLAKAKSDTAKESTGSNPPLIEKEKGKNEDQPTSPIIVEDPPIMDEKHESELPEPPSTCDPTPLPLVNTPDELQETDLEPTQNFTREQIPFVNPDEQFPFANDETELFNIPKESLFGFFVNPDLPESNTNKTVKNGINIRVIDANQEDGFNESSEMLNKLNTTVENGVLLECIPSNEKENDCSNRLKVAQQVALIKEMILEALDDETLKHQKVKESFENHVPLPPLKPHKAKPSEIEDNGLQDIDSDEDESWFEMHDEKLNSDCSSKKVQSSFTSLKMPQFQNTTNGANSSSESDSQDANLGEIIRTEFKATFSENQSSSDSSSSTLSTTTQPKEEDVESTSSLLSNEYVEPKPLKDVGIPSPINIPADSDTNESRNIVAAQECKVEIETNEHNSITQGQHEVSDKYDITPVLSRMDSDCLRKHNQIGTSSDDTFTFSPRQQSSKNCTDQKNLEDEEFPSLQQNQLTTDSMSSTFHSAVHPEEESVEYTSDLLPNQFDQPDPFQKGKPRNPLIIPGNSELLNIDAVQENKIENETDACSSIERSQLEINDEYDSSSELSPMATSCSKSIPNQNEAFRSDTFSPSSGIHSEFIQSTFDQETPMRFQQKLLEKQSSINSASSSLFSEIQPKEEDLESTSDFLSEQFDQLSPLNKEQIVNPLNVPDNCNVNYSMDIAAAEESKMESEINEFSSIKRGQCEHGDEYDCSSELSPTGSYCCSETNQSETYPTDTCSPLEQTSLDHPDQEGPTKVHPKFLKNQLSTDPISSNLLPFPDIQPKEEDIDSTSYLQPTAFDQPSSLKEDEFSSPINTPGNSDANESIDIAAALGNKIVNETNECTSIGLDHREISEEYDIKSEDEANECSSIERIQREIDDEYDIKSEDEANECNSIARIQREIDDEYDIKSEDEINECNSPGRGQHEMGDEYNIKSKEEINECTSLGRGQREIDYENDIKSKDEINEFNSIGQGQREIDDEYVIKSKDEINECSSLGRGQREIDDEYDIKSKDEINEFTLIGPGQREIDDEYNNKSKDEINEFTSIGRGQREIDDGYVIKSKDEINEFTLIGPGQREIDDKYNNKSKDEINEFTSIGRGQREIDDGYVIKSKDEINECTSPGRGQREIDYEYDIKSKDEINEFNSIGRGQREIDDEYVIKSKDEINECTSLGRGQREIDGEYDIKRKDEINEFTSIGRGQPEIDDEYVIKSKDEINEFTSIGRGQHEIDDEYVIKSKDEINEFTSLGRGQPEIVDEYDIKSKDEINEFTSLGRGQREIDDEYDIKSKDEINEFTSLGRGQREIDDEYDIKSKDEINEFTSPGRGQREIDDEYDIKSKDEINECNSPGRGQHEIGDEYDIKNKVEINECTLLGRDQCEIGDEYDMKSKDEINKCNSPGRGQHEMGDEYDNKNKDEINECSSLGRGQSEIDDEYNIKSNEEINDCTLLGRDQREIGDEYYIKSKDEINECISLGRVQPKVSDEYDSSPELSPVCGYFSPEPNQNETFPIATYAPHEQSSLDNFDQEAPREYQPKFLENQLSTNSSNNNLSTSPQPKEENFESTSDLPAKEFGVMDTSTPQAQGSTEGYQHQIHFVYANTGQDNSALQAFDSNVRIVYAAAAATAESGDDESGVPRKIRLLYAEALGYGGEESNQLQLVYATAAPNQQLNSIDGSMHNIQLMAPTLFHVPSEGVLTAENVQMILQNQQLQASVDHGIPYPIHVVHNDGMALAQTVVNHPENLSLIQRSHEMQNFIPSHQRHNHYDIHQAFAAQAGQHSFDMRSYSGGTTSPSHFQAQHRSYDSNQHFWGTESLYPHSSFEGDNDGLRTLARAATAVAFQEESDATTRAAAAIAAVGQQARQQRWRELRERGLVPNDNPNYSDNTNIHRGPRKNYLSQLSNQRK